MNAAVVLALGVLSALPGQVEKKKAVAKPEAAAQAQEQATKPAAKSDAKAAAPQVAVPAGPVVVTINDERIAAKPSAIQDGKLVLSADPPRLVPLDEVARVELGNAPTLAAKWIGQDNHDMVQVGGAAGGNGVQDMYVLLTGLATSRKLKQILAVCPHPKRQGVWKLDTTGTPNWRLAAVRAEGSDSADLYMEPNEDLFDQVLNLTITYEDGDPIKISTKITTHTDPQLKVDAAAAQPAATDAAPIRVSVYLEAGDRLRGELLALSKESLKLRTAWNSELEIPLLHAVAIEFGSSATPDARQRFDQHLRQPGAEDTALIRGQDQAIAVVTGSVEGFDEGKLRFSFQGEVRAINQPRLVGLVFAAHPPVRTGTAPYQVFQFTSGDRLSGTWTAIDGDSLELATAWGKPQRVPAAAVSEVAFRNGKMIYLSDLEPAVVEEVPYFGRLMSHRRDQSLAGEPLKMKGKPYTKGLAVHSRTVLTYSLDGQFETFKCLAGFDDSAGSRGRVVCRVLGDAKELFVEKDLRGDQEPASVEVPIAGVKQLVLEVDFGEAEDTGDRVIWADARLFRSDKR